MPELPHSGNAALGRSIGARRLTSISPSPWIIPSIARAPFPRALAFPTVLFWNDHPGARTNARTIILPIDIAISTLMMALNAILPSDDRGSPTVLAASTGCSECVNSRVHPIFQAPIRCIQYAHHQRMAPPFIKPDSTGRPQATSHFHPSPTFFRLTAGRPHGHCSLIHKLP